MASKGSMKNSTSKTLYGKIVYIEVGASKQRFGIHKRLLCDRSAFFKAAFYGSFKEAEEGVVVLGEEDAETFQRFNEWLYAKVLLQEHEKKDGSSYRILVDLFIFAEKMIIPRLQNDTIDALIRLDNATNQCLGPSTIERIWLDTAESSKLRRLAVDQSVYTANLGHNFDHTKNGGEPYDADFVRQVAMGLWATLWDSEANFRPDIRTYVDFELWKHRCRRYHSHEDAESLCDGSL